MRYLTLEEVLVLHDYQIIRFGGSHGLISLPLLESALTRPKTNISGMEMYASVFEKAAVLAFSIIKNHPFLDGNKRTGLHAALTFIELNGFNVKMSSKVLVKLGLDIANNVLDISDAVALFKKYSHDSS